MIVDCFTFSDQLDVLEIRLNTLAPYVDRFVLCESPYTHSTKAEKKRLYFDENKDRFKQFNITHLIIPDHQKYMGPHCEPYFYQVRYMINGLSDLKGDDIVLISDFDEIPDLSDYKAGEGSFRCREYYYYLNCYTGNASWGGTVARMRKSINSLGSVRRQRRQSPILGTGWHFTYMYSTEGVINKIKSIVHQEVNTDEIRSKVEECRKNLIDPFGRFRRPFMIEDPTGPQWLLDNRDKYKHLFYKDES